MISVKMNEKMAKKMNFVASTSIWELIEISGFCFGKYGLMGI